MKTIAYFFNNMYLNGIHAGIQTAHSVAELLITHRLHPDVQQWAMLDKTIIILNGGYASNLSNLFDLAVSAQLPVVSFRESEEALNGALTNVGVVLNESVYGTLEIMSECRKQYPSASAVEIQSRAYDIASKLYGVTYSDSLQQFISAYQRLPLMR